MRLCLGILLLASGALHLGSSSAAAQRNPTGAVGRATRVVPGLDRVGVQEHLDEAMPLELSFRDEAGQAVTLGDYVDGERPVLFLFAYHSCRTLCSLVLNATVEALQGVEWTVGEQYDVVVLSIDPNDTPATAAHKRDQIAARYGRGEGGWHFLVGDEAQIQAATEAAGVRFFYDAVEEQYAHPAVIMLLTPEGKLARYLYGISFPASDVRLALLEASEGRSISTVEQIILYCYSYNQDEHGYSLMAMNVMKIGGGITALALGGFILLFWLRERRRTQLQIAKGGPQGPQTNQVGTT
ncbi:MAG: SCO family protein [Myxococcales bacterium]|nr:SCO family protein [Myxococcales bacterium]